MAAHVVNWALSRPMIHTMIPQRRMADPVDPGAPPAPPETGSPVPIGVIADMTGRALTELVEARIAGRPTGEVLGVMRGELDRADAIGDACGPEVSEAVAEAMIRRIRAVLRETDLLARFGRHGWVAVIQDLPGWRDLELVAGRALVAARQTVALADDLEHLVTTSVGLAAASDPGASARAVIGRAERACERVRVTGGDRFVFGHQDHRSGRASLELDRDLRRALAADQFELSYQAVRRVGGPPAGPVDRFEVMTRWRHPVRGAQRTATFLPAVVEAGLGGRFTELLLDRVCRCAVDTSVSSGRITTVSVDLDLDLVDGTADDRGLPELVARALERHALPAGQLELEFEVRQLDRAGDGLAGALSRLALMGVRLSADQIEPSLSTLATLEGWPVLTGWKLERSVAEALDPRHGTRRGPTPLARAGIEAIVAAAAEHRVEVTALGVDSVEAATALEELGVPLLQGRYIQQSLRSMV